MQNHHHHQAFGILSWVDVLGVVLRARVVNLKVSANSFSQHRRPFDIPYRYWVYFLYLDMHSLQIYSHHRLSLNAPNKKFLKG